MIADFVSGDLQLGYFAINRIIFYMYLYQCQRSSSKHIKLPKTFLKINVEKQTIFDFESLILQ